VWVTLTNAGVINLDKAVATPVDGGVLYRPINKTFDHRSVANNRNYKKHNKY